MKTLFSGANTKIATGFIWSALFLLLVKILSAGKEVVVASNFGVEARVDAFVFIFTLATWPVGLWFSVLTAVLLPAAARLSRERSNDMPAFWGQMLGLSTLIGLTLSIGFLTALPLVLRTSWFGISTEMQRYALEVIPAMSLLLLMGLQISLLSVQLMAAGRHINTLFEAAPAVTVLCALLIPGEEKYTRLVWATVAGYLVHLIFLGYSLHGERLLRVTFRLRSEYWLSLRYGFGVVLLGQFIMSLSGIVDQFFVVPLDAGSIAALGYSNRLLGLVLGLGATAMVRAALPVFSAFHAEDAKFAWRATLRWCGLMFILGCVVAGAGFFGADAGVKFLYERGAFTPEDTVEVSGLFKLSVLQVPFYFSSIVVVAYFTSRESYRLIAVVAGCGVFVKLVCMWILTPALHVHGVVLSTVAMYFVNFLVLMVLFFTCKK